MITIDQDKCIGCGLCARDCLPRAIEIVDGKARFLADHNCMRCGHCEAICPRNAVTLDGIDRSEIVNLRDINHELDADVFLNHMRTRRTIRSFKTTPVTKDVIERLLDTGRFSPTGGNRQNVAYHVFTETIGELRDRIIAELKSMGEEETSTGKPSSWYPEFWVETAKEYEATGRDSIFFNAPAVIAVSSDVPQAACLASAHMETMANALGLGVLYSGFSVRAINHSAELQSFLKLKEGYAVWCVLVLGHPAVKYQRTVSRNPADVLWD